RVGGSISVSFARAKPFVDGNIEVERLDLTDVAPPARAPRAGETKAGASGGAKPPADSRGSHWRDRPISFTGPRMVEVHARIAAREIVLDKVHLGPADLEATLLEDKLSIVLPRSQLYGGQGTGELTIDAAKPVPAVSLRFDLSGVNVLPILSDTANFEYVDGRGGAKFDLKASGESPLQLVSSLRGTAPVLFSGGRT